MSWASVGAGMGTWYGCVAPYIEGDDERWRAPELGLRYSGGAAAWILVMLPKDAFLECEGEPTGLCLTGEPDIVV
jgi:hypothetical protein